MFARSLIATVLLCATITAYAEEITPWNFRGNMPFNPQDVLVTTGTKAEITPTGMSISTPTDGYVLWANSPLKGPVDVITIRASASHETQASVLWQEEGQTDGFVQAYVTIPGDGFMHDIDVVISGYQQWDWRTDKFGIAFPGGSTILIEEIRFRHWTFYERIIEGWKSFWIFDTFRSYSINFLWGPLVASNSVLREQMFETLPPMGWAIGRFLYPLFLIIAIAGVIIGRLKKNGSLGLGLFLALFVFCWIILDIRMGAELVSYGVNDLQQYVFASEKEKELRAFGDMYAKADALLPEIRTHERFTLLSPTSNVYFPVFRYGAYPSVIVPDATTASGVTAWAVVDRNDVWVDANGMLRMGDRSASGTVLAGPGQKTATFNDITFLFITNP